MSPQMMQNLLKPALACELLGADFVFVVDMVLLELDPMVTEAAPE